MNYSKKKNRIIINSIASCNNIISEKPGAKSSQVDRKITKSLIIK